MYDNPGNYTLTLKVTNEAGNSSTTTQQITVQPDSRRTIFVDVNGNDANNCSYAAPCRTLSGAFARVASGGEISRIALALKTCLAAPKSRVIRTLVFDEVDAGVGGSAAEGVGRRLKKLAGANQVLCVTHLPQIASFADHHYRVEKQESRGRTVAVLQELEGEARTREIGRMLSGQKLTPEALKNAEQLIKLSVA